MTTWRTAIAGEMQERGDPGPIVSCTLTAEALDLEFSANYGATNGLPFTAWTALRVYFPACYDGSEWCTSVPRDPCDESTSHVGGG